MARLEVGRAVSLVLLALLLALALGRLGADLLVVLLEGGHLVGCATPSVRGAATRGRQRGCDLPTVASPGVYRNYRFRFFRLALLGIKFVMTRFSNSFS